MTYEPCSDGNGRTARLISGYILDYYGYGFQGIGSLEEFFAYDADEYYSSLQMGLPALYYSGRDNPPHPEIWIGYFLRMMELYSKRICEISSMEKEDNIQISLSFLNSKEKELLCFLIHNNMNEFTPIETAKKIGVTNRTIINRTANLVNHGFVVPIIVKERIRSYRMSDYTKENAKEICSMIGFL